MYVAVPTEDLDNYFLYEEILANYKISVRDKSILPFYCHLFLSGNAFFLT